MADRLPANHWESDPTTLLPASLSERATLAPSATEAALPPSGLPSTQVGDTLAPPGYEILGELGRGGMGVVYKARQVKADRLVALKMILAGGHADRAERQRFQTEAEAVARLQHPGIVQVFEIGEYDGRAFFSLELCAGGSLDRKLAGTPLPPTQAAALVKQLAQAMQAAHDAHVIHRDLKPANVLLTADGTPKITDFGLAKKLDEIGQTATGSVMGTPSYMAPEQAEGKRDIGPPVDVYALGAILYECLTGRPPFKAATAFDTVLQVLGEEPVGVRQLNRAVHRDLEVVCLKCLHKDSQKRYPSAAALAADLELFLDGEPITAQQSGLIGQLAGVLDRVQLHSRFATYGSLLLGLAPVMALPELWITAVVENDGPGHLLGLGQFGRVAGFLLLLGYHRGWRWGPEGPAERQLWGVWGGYLLACFALGMSGRVAARSLDSALELTFYPGLSVLTALAFFALAGNFWGYCAVIGLGFLGLSLTMAADLRWAPLEFGAAWAVTLVLLGTRLRRLGRQAEDGCNIREAA